MKTIYLNASDIASYTSTNPYDNIQTFDRFFKKYFSDTYKRFLIKSNTKIEQKKITTKSLLSFVDAKATLVELTSTTEILSENITESLKVSKDIIDASIKTIQTAQLLSSTFILPDTVTNEDISKTQFNAKKAINDFNDSKSLPEKQKAFEKLSALEKTIKKHANVYVKVLDTDLLTQNVFAEEKQIKEIIDRVDLLTLTPKEFLKKNLVDIDDTINNPVASVKKTTEDIRRKNISNDDEKILRAKAAHIINTSHGIKKESETLTKLQKHDKIKATDNLYTIKASQNSNVTWNIIGKVDGLDHEKKQVIEIKNRINGLFYKVKEYELLQVNIYMLMTGFKSARLVQQYKDDISETVLLYDENVIENMFNRLMIFSEKIEELFNNDRIIYMYFNSNDEQKNLILDNLFRIKQKDNSIKSFTSKAFEKSQPTHSNKVINPLTKRWITIDGAVYKNLKAKGIIS